MITKPFKNNMDLSSLGLGTMRLPTKRLKTRIDFDKAQEMVDYSIENGINYFDTAYVYHFGQSEGFLGKALRNYPRDSYNLATKYFMLASKNYKRVFFKQLSRLNTNYIDFYLIHSVTDGSADRYIESGAIEFFKEQKRLGRIRHLGFSSHASVKTLERFADYTDWDFAQIQLNYYDWFYNSARKEYETLYNRNIPIMVMEPVRGGQLAKVSYQAKEILDSVHPDWSPASWALRFVKELPGVQTVLSGMTTLDQLKDNINTFSDDYKLSEADHKTLAFVSNLHNKNFKIPCTECHYCVETCPKKIDIPDFLRTYNKYLSGNTEALKELRTIESTGRPADCINCKLCTQHCPQNIQIPDLMKEMRSL